MATEILFITGIASSTGPWTGNDTDIDEGISAADGAEVSSASNGEGDAVLFNLANSALTDADTITRVDIQLRGRVTTDGGDESFTIALFIGGVGQGAVSGSAGELTNTQQTLSARNTAAWNTDWTAAELDGMQVEAVGAQAGMPTSNVWHIDCGEVVITFTPPSGASILRPRLQTPIYKHILTR